MCDETDIASFDLSQVENQLTKSIDQSDMTQLTNSQSERLTPLSPEVISHQATINIGTIGHVAHGKSTLVKALSGVQTVRFKNELERNITIKLGYANAKIYRCDTCPNDQPGRYCSRGSNHVNSFPCPNQTCQHGTMELQRHISFVDCFGQDTRVLMADRSFKLIDQVVVGDQLMGDDLTPRRVVKIQKGQKPLFQIKYVVLSTGRFKEIHSFYCTAGHLLVLRIPSPAKIQTNDSGQYTVEYCSSSQDGRQIMLLENIFDQKQVAFDFYQKVNRPLNYQITVDAFSSLPSQIQEWSILYRINTEKQIIPIHSFSIDRPNPENPPQDYIGLETDGNQRFLLSDGLVVHNCPGHDILMATMLNGAAVMDGALLLIAGNEKCPQPQTKEHLAAVEIMRLTDIILVQNKLDLISQQQAEKQYNQEIKQFVKHTVAENSPVVPISAQLKDNVDVICEYICTQIPVPVRDFNSAPRMMVVRSFDINKPGTKHRKLKGGVAGGTLVRGILRTGQTVEIRPGIVTKDSNTNQPRCRPLITEITSLFSEGNMMDYAVPGGLIGVGTKLDPTLCRADRLIGQVMGAVGTLPDVYQKLEVEYRLLDRVIGVESEAQVADLTKGEALMVNVGSVSVTCNVISVKQSAPDQQQTTESKKTKNQKSVKLNLTSPVCTAKGEKIAISRNVDQHWRLIGWGIINRGKPVEIMANI